MVKKSIIFISLPRANGTIILRSFGQLAGSEIYNEYLTTLPLPNRPWSGNVRKEKVDSIIKQANTHANNGTLCFHHEIVGTVSLGELQLLKPHFTIVAVIRHPRKQLTSLKRLSDASDAVCQNLLEHGWKNIHKYHEEKLIDHVLDAERYINEEIYRRNFYKQLGLEYHANCANNLVRFHGEEFHPRCEVTRNVANASDNPWNGPAAISLKLHPDTTPHITDNKLNLWEKSFMPFMTNVFTTLVNGYRK